MEIDMQSLVGELEEYMNKMLIDKFLTDENVHLLIECLHNHGMSYRNILKAFMEYDEKKKEKEK